MYRHRDINMRNIHITENSLNCITLYLMCRTFTLYVATYLANRTERYCPKWPPPMEMVGTEFSNKRLEARAGERTE